MDNHSMDNYRQVLKEETEYLKNTINFLSCEVENAAEDLTEQKQNLIASRKDMWENTAHSARDFTKLTEIVQYQTEVNNQAFSYLSKAKQVEKYRRIQPSPYFGRIDLIEENSDFPEKIYIGLTNVMDKKNHDVYVYDWRAPISSIFYRYELGKAAYSAPMGQVNCDVLLKRQYKIQNGCLKYFFDCSIRITDEILQDVLSHNSSPKMKNIVETIQREQDIIIRDTANQLLVVQGVAGSGKTSVALHRVAFLLYQGLNSNLQARNFIIISPNAIFSSYIASVLPELGEENVRQITYSELLTMLFKGRFTVESRESQLEVLINSRNTNTERIKRKSIALKGSRDFLIILQRMLWHYTHHVIPFEDVYFEGVTLETGQRLKNRFLNNKIGIPMAKQLQRLENMLLNKMRPLQKRKLEKIEKMVAINPEHLLEIKSYSRLLSMKIGKTFRRKIYSFTRIDYFEIYRMLFNNSKLFYRLAEGIALPQEIESIICTTRKNIEEGTLAYEDCAPLLYLMIKVHGCDCFEDIKHVVIDEAQDYLPLQYEIFKLLFKTADYTIMGDINQSLEKDRETSFYDEIAAILAKEKTLKLFLNKGYRSSFEINAFCRELLNSAQEFESFERHEEAPSIKERENPDHICRTISEDIRQYLEEGYESIAVICKNNQEAESVYSQLPIGKIRLVKASDDNLQKGVVIVPAYLAKGLEFDVVLVYGVNKENYSTHFDRKLLYVACTRALHRLVLYYCGEPSPFIKQI